MKYRYTGNEPAKYIDVTGQVFFLEKGDVFEPKVKPNWDTIEEQVKKAKERIKNDSSK